MTEGDQVDKEAQIEKVRSTFAPSYERMVKLSSVKRAMKSPIKPVPIFVSHIGHVIQSNHIEENEAQIKLINDKYDEIEQKHLNLADIYRQEPKFDHQSRQLKSKQRVMSAKLSHMGQLFDKNIKPHEIKPFIDEETRLRMLKEEDKQTTYKNKDPDK